MIMPTEPTEEVKENKYDYTIFKSGYWHGGYQCQLFLNYGYGQYPDSYSLILKKGKFSQVHNLTKDEKLGFAKAILSKLSSDELTSLGLKAT